MRCFPRIATPLVAALILILAGCEATDPAAPDARRLAPEGSARSAVTTIPASITVIPALPGFPLASPQAINNNGQAVGSSRAASSFERRPWIWSQSDGTAALALPPTHVGSASGTSAGDINDSGVIVGSGPNQPLIWNTPTSAPAFLPMPAGHGDGVAPAINSSGVAVGKSSPGHRALDGRALRWPNGTASVEQLAGPAGTHASEINDSGEIAGWQAEFVISPCCFIAFDLVRWVGGTLDVIGRFGNTFWAIPHAIGDDGTIVGRALDGTLSPFSVSRKAFLWNEDEGVTQFTAADLGLTGGSAASFTGINAAGQVSGFAVGSTDHAFVWSDDDGVRFLPPLVPGGRALADDINDHGQILGRAENANGAMEAVVWTLSLTVTIEVHRVINVRGRRGVIPVTVYTTSTDDGEDTDFDATTIDMATVTFGPDGAAPAHGGHLEDADGDGDTDAVFHFPVGASGVACGDTEATLTGSTTDGTAIEGADEIRVVGC